MLHSRIILQYITAMSTSYVTQGALSEVWHDHNPSPCLSTEARSMAICAATLVRSLHHSFKTTVKGDDHPWVDSRVTLLTYQRRVTIFIGTFFTGTFI